MVLAYLKEYIIKYILLIYYYILLIYINIYYLYEKDNF